MGIKISEMTPDASLGGGELLAVSDAGSAKSVTITGIKNFTVDQIEAITAGTAVSGADGVFILQSGALKPVDIDLVAQHAIDTIWGKANDASPAGTDKVAIKDAGTTENTVTLANLATYVQGAIRAATLNPATLDAAGGTSTADVFIIGQSGVAKKITLTELNSAVLAGLNAYVTALTAVTVSADSDVLYVIQGGVQKKVTLAEIKTLFGVLNAVQGPAVTTANYVPQWDSTSKLLKEGLEVKTSVGAVGGTSTSLVDETAVRAAIDLKITLPTSAETAIDTGDTLIMLDASDSDNPVTIPAESVGVQLGETSATSYRGDRGKTAYDHSQVAHAPSDAQKNSDILQAEIEAKLTGAITTHTHAGLADANDKGTYATEAALTTAIPAGEAGWYAVVVFTGTTWIWDVDAGPAAWVDSTLSPDLALGETDSTAYRGDRGKIAYDHSQVAHLALGETDSTAYRGDRGVIAYDHSQAAHAPINAVAGINDQTGTTYTLVLLDAGKLVRCANAASIALTVPTNLSVAFAVGAVITIEQSGAGVITVAEASGVVVNSFDSGMSSAGIYSMMQLIKVATDQWTLVGGVV